MKTAALIAGAAAVAAIAALLLAHSGSVPAVAPAAPLTVRASVEPPVAQLGDPLTARVEIELDRAAVDAQSVHVTNELAPLTLLSAAQTTRTVSGRLETLSIVQRAACLTDACLKALVSLPTVHVTAKGRDGGVLIGSSTRQLHLRRRVSAADLAAATPRFAADTTPPAPSYRIAPHTAATALDAIAALAAAGAAALLVLQALALGRGRRREVTGDELTRALRLVREAEERPAPDRRRALALLARLLRTTALGTAASDLAWSEPVPGREAIDALVTDVESERAG